MYESIIIHVFLLLFQHGAEITDHKIFSELTQHWENEYHSDMKALNVSSLKFLMLFRFIAPYLRRMLIVPFCTFTEVLPSKHRVNSLLENERT